MDADIRTEAQDLEDTKGSLELDVGSCHNRIRLLELTLSQSVSLTRRITDELITEHANRVAQQSVIDRLSYTVAELEAKIDRIMNEQS